MRPDNLSAGRAPCESAMRCPLTHTPCTPTALANLALYGLFAALYALREGGIWGISAQHTAWNWAQGNIFGLQVSGIGTSKRLP